MIPLRILLVLLSGAVVRAVNQSAEPSTTQVTLATGPKVGLLGTRHGRNVSERQAGLEVPEPTLLTLLEGNGTDDLLDLSDAMLSNASTLLETAVEAVNSSVSHGVGVPRLSPLRREEETIKELADHSGKLQRLFKKLEKDLTADYDYGPDSINALGPASHIELSEDTIDWIPQEKNLRTQEEAEKQQAFRGLIVVLLAGILLVGVGVLLWLQGRAPEPAAEEKPRGSMQYVIRIERARIADLPSRTALAWQIAVGGEKPRPSRFTNLAVWDAPLDRLDVEVSGEKEKISVEILQQSASLGPPATIGTVEIPARVLLAEATRNKEKVMSGGDGAFMHEKKLALYPRGELVLEYSLIAFFHWYVGEDGKKM